MTALYHHPSDLLVWFFFLKRHTPFSAVSYLFLSPVLSSLPSKALLQSAHPCTDVRLNKQPPFLAPIRMVQVLVDFTLSWLKKKNHYILYVSQLYWQCAAGNLLAAVAHAQKQTCTHCSTTDLAALAMLRLSPNDAVLQKGALPAV